MIHSTAIVSPKAKIGKNVTIGPFAIIEENVTIEDNCRIDARVSIVGHTTIGSGTTIRIGSVIGGEPQDLSYDGSRSYTKIGKNCRFSEYITINRGAMPESTTIIGNNVMLMAMVHIAHNCQIADHVIIANNTVLGGHVHVEKQAFLSASLAIHQFVRIGRLAMAGGLNRIVQDLPPFCMMQEEVIQGINAVGLRRSNIQAETRKAIRQAVKIFFFKELNRINALKEIENKFPNIPEIKEFVDFIAQTERGIISGRIKK